MNSAPRRLRTPEERVGGLPNASLPPPRAGTGTLLQDARASDDLLMRALLQRDEAAFAQAADLYFSSMLRVALAYVRDRPIAEEVVQDTWLAAMSAIHRFEQRSSLKTWLFRIVRNVARARARKESRTVPMTDLGAADGDDAGPDAADFVVDGRTANGGIGRGAMWTRSRTPEEELLAAEMSRRIDAAIAGLPARQQEVLVLRDVEGWSAEDVCNTLGISDTNQRVILHRARDRVRQELGEYLDDDPSNVYQEHPLH